MPGSSLYIYYKNIDIYYIGRITIKNFSYTKINTVNPLYFIINKADGYIKENNENKYLPLISTGKNILKKYTQLWIKIKNLIETINGKRGDYDEKYMKIKFTSDDNLPLNKILKFYNLTIAVRFVFQEDKKYYPQASLDEFLCEL